jgi:hypothetical protein
MGFKTWSCATDLFLVAVVFAVVLVIWEWICATHESSEVKVVTPAVCKPSNSMDTMSAR